MVISFVASQPSYEQHLRPIWNELDDDERGEFIDHRWEPGARAADVWVAASARDLMDARHKRGVHVMMEHGVGLQWYRGPELAAVLSADLVLAPNDFIADHYRRAGFTGELCVIGTPRLDELDQVVYVGNGKTVGVSFHWSEILKIADSRSIAKRYRDAIRGLTTVAHLDVVAHAHPKLTMGQRPGESAIEKLYDQLNVQMFTRSFDDVVALADVYACDHSSTLYEFAALGRPVVLLDRERGPESVPAATGLRYTYHGNIGAHASPETLVPEVQAALAGPDAFRAQRELATRELYPYRGLAARRATWRLRALH